MCTLCNGIFNHVALKLHLIEYNEFTHRHTATASSLSCSIYFFVFFFTSTRVAFAPLVRLLLYPFRWKFVSCPLSNDIVYPRLCTNIFSPGIYFPPYVLLAASNLQLLMKNTMYIKAMGVTIFSKAQRMRSIIKIISFKYILINTYYCLFNNNIWT